MKKPLLACVVIIVGAIGVSANRDHGADKDHLLPGGSVDKNGHLRSRFDKERDNYLSFAQQQLITTPEYIALFLNLPAFAPEFSITVTKGKERATAVYRVTLRQPAESFYHRTLPRKGIYNVTIHVARAQLDASVGYSIERILRTMLRQTRADPVQKRAIGIDTDQIFVSQSMEKTVLWGRLPLLEGPNIKLLRQIEMHLFELCALPEARRAKVQKALAYDCDNLLRNLRRSETQKAKRGQGLLLTQGGEIDTMWAMARPLRIEYEGALYHVVSRGDRREDIFVDGADRRAFLDCLGRACGKTGWQVYAWCLLSNHFHLVMETPQANLAVGMKWLLGTYTQRFNRRHRSSGHVPRPL